MLQTPPPWHATVYFDYFCGSACPIQYYTSLTLDSIVLEMQLHFGSAGTPAENAPEVRKRKDYHWKSEFKSFPTVYDTPTSLNIGMSYTIGTFLNPAFQWSVPHRGTQTCHCVLIPCVPGYGLKVKFSHNLNNMIDVLCYLYNMNWPK